MMNKRKAPVADDEYAHQNGRYYSRYVKRHYNHRRSRSVESSSDSESSDDEQEKSSRGHHDQSADVVADVDYHESKAQKGNKKDKKYQKHSKKSHKKTKRSRSHAEEDDEEDSFLRNHPFIGKHVYSRNYPNEHDNNILKAEDALH